MSLRAGFPPSWALVLAMIAATPAGVAQVLDPAIVSERLQRLTSVVESLELTLASQKRQIDTLTTELQQLREQVTRQANQKSWAQDIQRLGDAIAEVDKKRVADSEQVVKVLNELRKAIAAGGGEARSSAGKGSSSGGGRAAKASPSKPTDKATEALPYTIEKGQTLSELLEVFNQDAKKRGYQALTVQQVMEFNDISDARRIQQGATIMFPLIPK